jgi:hypothetical protein
VRQRLASSAGRKPSLRSPRRTRVAEIHPPRATEVLVERRAGSIGEGLLGELVQAFVCHFDGVLRLAIDAVEVTDLDGQPRAFQSCVLDRRLSIEHFVDTPTAVRRLAPTGPVEVDVSDDPRWLPLAGQSVRRLPRQVAQQDIHLEVLIEGLPLEESGLERVSERADRVGEHMVEHLRR